jgi:hypothetical protein
MAVSIGSGRLNIARNKLVNMLIIVEMITALILSFAMFNYFYAFADLRIINTINKKIEVSNS